MFDSPPTRKLKHDDARTRRFLELLATWSAWFGGESLRDEDRLGFAPIAAKAREVFMLYSMGAKYNADDALLELSNLVARHSRATRFIATWKEMWKLARDPGATAAALARLREAAAQDVERFSDRGKPGAILETVPDNGVAANATHRSRAPKPLALSPEVRATLESAGAVVSVDEEIGETVFALGGFRLARLKSQPPKLDWQVPAFGRFIRLLFEAAAPRPSATRGATVTARDVLEAAADARCVVETDRAFGTRKHYIAYIALGEFACVSESGRGDVAAVEFASPAAAVVLRFLTEFEDELAAVAQPRAIS